MPLFLTEDGSHSIFSDQFQVPYHSKHGAIQETQHVFINAGLKHIAERPQTHVAILEVGFGTGLNAFMTYLEAERTGLTIDFTTLEAYPLSIQTVSELNYIAQLQAESSQDVFNLMHQADWDSVHPLSIFFNFTKKLGIFEEAVLPVNTYDLIYFDAFAPESQPHLWEENFLELMYNCLKHNGIMTTYCAKGVVKRRLKGLGFTVETLPGPPGKREMIKSVKNNI
jgi:tRNA U34 5-methylaminomethyl-2-thiouridine-forming methyltransferase MnmC